MKKVIVSIIVCLAFMFVGVDSAFAEDPANVDKWLEYNKKWKDDYAVYKLKKLQFVDAYCTDVSKYVEFRFTSKDDLSGDSYSPVGALRFNYPFSAKMKSFKPDSETTVLYEFGEFVTNMPRYLQCNGSNFLVVMKHGSFDVVDGKKFIFKPNKKTVNIGDKEWNPADLVDVYYIDSKTPNFPSNFFDVDRISIGRAVKDAIIQMESDHKIKFFNFMLQYPGAKINNTTPLYFFFEDQGSIYMLRWDMWDRLIIKGL
jgi:hypothetical protein